MESTPISSNTHHNPNALAAVYEKTRDVVTFVVPKVIAATSTAMSYTVQFLTNTVRNFSLLHWQQVDHTDFKVAAVYKDHDGNLVEIVGQSLKRSQGDCMINYLTPSSRSL